MTPKETKNTSAIQFQAKLVGKVREDSKNLAKPTRVDSLRALVPDLKHEEIQASLDGIAKNANYRDIKSALASDDTTYFFSERYLTEDRAKSLARAEEFQIRLAKRVREDSKNLAKPTRLDSVVALASGLKPEEIQASLDEIVKNDNCLDIKSVTAFTGTVYLFSERYITEDCAKSLTRVEEFQATLVKKVRGDSKYLAELTKLDAVAARVPDLRPEEIKASLAEIVKNDSYRDIQSVVASTGSVYLFSEISMTKNYAQILARVEANDPCFTIAEMVREESKTYPRPTNIELFKYKLFKIDHEELDTHIARTLERYPDVKLIRTPKGAIYLYSTLYLDETSAQMLADVLGGRRPDD